MLSYDKHNLESHVTSHPKKQKIFLRICWLALGLTDAQLIGF